MLLLGHDMAVAEWAHRTFGYARVQYDCAIGIVRHDRIVGAAMFHAWSGDDIEFSYYGPGTMTLATVRDLARIAVEQFGVSRVTVRTARNNKIMTKSIKKIGFEFEGIRKHGYGQYDAVMFGLYGEKLAKLAQKTVH